MCGKAEGEPDAVGGGCSKITHSTLKIVGITGGIGSGKSIISKFFEILEIPVYYADERAKWLTNNDIQLKKEIKELLGRQAYDENGQYNRKWVAAQVFGNPEVLKMLNQLIHPRVFEDTIQWLKKHQNNPYVVREAALVNSAKESGLDKIIVVTAPLEIRIERIKKRDTQRTEEEIRQIISRQKTDEEFLKLADFEIKNDDKTMLIPQIIKLHQILQVEI